MDYTKVMNYDKRQVDSKWASIAMTEFIAPSEENINKKVSCHPQTETGDARSLAYSHFGVIEEDTMRFQPPLVCTPDDL